MAPQKKRDNTILISVFSSPHARMKARKLYMDGALCHKEGLSRALEKYPASILETRGEES
jgi:formaldehyde-activating enzyme involved in methanogenesis